MLIQIAILYKLSEGIAGTLLNSFSEVNIILIPKPDKEITRKENHRSISFVNIVAKILKKLLAK